MTLLNPVDDSVVVDDIPIASEADVDRAVAAADEAFRRGPWSTFTGSERAACLSKFADLVEQNAEQLAYAESLPTGRPVSGILHFDLKHMVQVYRCKAKYNTVGLLGRPSAHALCAWFIDYAGWADKIAGQSFAEDKNGFAKIVRYKPLGVCAAIASWNATFMYVGWKLAPALAAGNTVSIERGNNSISILILVILRCALNTALTAFTDRSSTSRRRSHH